MYLLMLVALLGLGAGLCVFAVRKERWVWGVIGGIILLVTLLFFGSLDWIIELLWYEALGYTSRFWTDIWARVRCAVFGGLVAVMGVALILGPILRTSYLFRTVPLVVAGGVGVVWGLLYWENGLVYLNAVNTGETDPILGMDVGFYLFRLPFYDNLYWLLLGTALIGFLSALVATILRATDIEIEEHPWGTILEELEEPIRERKEDEPFPFARRSPRSSGRSEPPTNQVMPFRPLCYGLGALGVVLGIGILLSTYHLMYSTWGAVTGPGWTDVKIRLPAYYILATLLFLASLVLFIPPWCAFILEAIQRILPVDIDIPVPDLRQIPSLVALAGTLAVICGLGVVVIPGLVQWLIVEPNEITREEPYIKHNIHFTRQGFDLHQIEEQPFPVSGELTPDLLNEHKYKLDQVRLWDPRALKAVYKQFQEIRLYYEFSGVDIDRYSMNGLNRQVMVSAREMESSNLPESSQTFVNRRFKYTHGFGLTLAPVNAFTSQGLPDLLVKDIPPQTRARELEVEEPRIYYGERSSGYVVVNTREEEFDYPRGKENVYNRYSGKGGVQLSSLWRKFLFGWKFDGARFFFSGYPTRESRVMFYRQIQRRVKKLAPFLTFDRDPYIVLNEGKLYWIVDGYTTSRYYPYSEPFTQDPTQFNNGEPFLKTGVVSSLQGINYIRNSVKAVVDAYQGTVTFYVFDTDDPILKVWRQIYPELFHDRDQMPGGLQAHVRYPEGFLLVQGLVYAKYHMTDPAVFYNQEDLWVRATEKYHTAVQPVEPYYVMWKPPRGEGIDQEGVLRATTLLASPLAGVPWSTLALASLSDSTRSSPEFILMLPFTPKNRQVLIGWLAGMCDGVNYGRLLAYRFPKEKRVLGTQQVETKIDQDPVLSGQLTLWDQRGSKVIRGNVLVIPIQRTLLYVEPIYLQAEAAAYPELRLVAVMHNDTLSYAPTFDEALQGLFKKGSRKLPAVPQPAQGSISELAQQANSAFENYLRLQGQQKFQEAARELETLRNLLQQMTQPPKQTPKEKGDQ